MTDTAKSSWITDHPFVPRLIPVIVGNDKRRAVNPHLCGVCNMAEAAHAETTVKR